jgi:hypothetical protein
VNAPSDRKKLTRWMRVTLFWATWGVGCVLLFERRYNDAAILLTMGLLIAVVLWRTRERHAA